MQFLVSLNNPQLAQRFIGYLASKEIICTLTVNAKEDKAIIWLQTLEYQQEAQKELNLFLAQPYADRYKEYDSKYSIKLSCQQILNAISTITCDFVRGQGSVTLTIFSLTVLIYLCSVLGFQESIYHALLSPSTLKQALIEPWRLLTPVLLHFSSLHIVSNLLCWWILGRAIEYKQNKKCLLCIVFVSGLLSNIGQNLVSGPLFGGLSGIVYGLLGYIWWMQWLAPKQGLCIPNAYVGFMLIWLVFGYFDPMGLTMANAAHLIGLISGCLLAALACLTRYICKKPL